MFLLFATKIIRIIESMCWPLFEGYAWDAGQRSTVRGWSFTLCGYVVYHMAWERSLIVVLWSWNETKSRQACHDITTFQSDLFPVKTLSIKVLRIIRCDENSEGYFSRHCQVSHDFESQGEFHSQMSSYTFSKKQSLVFSENPSAILKYSVVFKRTRRREVLLSLVESQGSCMECGS